MKVSRLVRLGALVLLAGCLPKATSAQSDLQAETRKPVYLPVTPVSADAPAPAPAQARPRPAPLDKDVARRRWAATGSIAVGRYYSTLTKLRDGRALLVGGLTESSSAGRPEVDLYNPATGEWTAAAPLHLGRRQFAAVLLADGRVLVAGGAGPTGAITDTVEIYNPRTNAWTTAAAMGRPRVDHSMALLADGRVLAAGGRNGVNSLTRRDGVSAQSSAEIYDPVADAWSPAAPMAKERHRLAMAALGNGKVMVSGGNDDSSSHASAEIYDPAANAWSPAGSMSVRRFAHQLAVLPGGKVIAAGGANYDGMTNTADVYDPATNKWTATGPLGVERYCHAMAVVNATAVIIGGENHSTNLDSTEIYDAASNGWRPGPRMTESRSYPQAVVLDDGRVLVASGRKNVKGGPEMATAELLGASGSSGPIAAESRAPVPAPRPASVLDSENPENLPPAAAPRPHAHAVVIGIERYRGALPRADFAASDAKLAAEYFRRVFGVPEENLALLSDDRATKSDFEKHFERWLPNRVEPGDEVYVYFSGHGAPNPKTGESYLVPFDADPTYIEQTGYPIKKLYEVLAKLPAKRVLLVMDSCFSGAGGRSVIAQGARPLVTVVQSDVPRPLTVITASAGDQISNSYQEKRHGLFTYFFLKGLKEKGTDFRGVYDYLKPLVSRVARRQYNSDQDPQWRKGK